MLNLWAVKALARAFVEGESAPRAIAERCAALLGKEWRGLRPLAARFLETVSGEGRPRRLTALRFLLADERFSKARKDLSIAHWRHEPGGTMQPMAAAQSWALPAIEGAAELAAWLGIGAGELTWFADLKGLGSRASEPRLRHYRYRVLQKDATNVRLIEAPKARLKELQRKILADILERVPLHDAVHGFRKGRSIQTFCAPHAGRAVVLKMDLRDFFPAIGRARIQSLFRTLGYPEEVADLLGGLCTNAAPSDIWSGVSWETRKLYARPHLPQGAPSSPALANLCAYHADCRLRGLAEAAGAAYTRYADDLAFSGGGEFARSADRFAAQTAAILTEEGFAVHHRKTRVMRRGVRQQLTGLVVNERPNIRRGDFDSLKATLTNCARLGAESQNREGHERFRAHLQGRVAFVESVNPAKGARLRSLFERIDWRTGGTETP